MKISAWVFAAALLFPVAALAFFKPSRVFVPEAFGVACPDRRICTDDPLKQREAAELYRTARQYLETQWGLVIGEPKVIFCSTEACKDRFGLRRRAAYTIGTVAIVVAPRGWKDYYVQHELVHYWQAANFGSLVLLTGEKWLVEGMAYSLSNDPRQPLSEPFESYRRTFNEWRQRNSDKPFVEAVRKEL